MAPTIHTTKLVATAIATFASTDKFIIFPSIMAATLMTPVFEFFLFLIASNFSALMGCQAQCEQKDQDGKLEVRRKN
jgi:hypothetical protein